MSRSKWNFSSPKINKLNSLKMLSLSTYQLTPKGIPLDQKMQEYGSSFASSCKSKKMGYFHKYWVEQFLFCVLNILTLTSTPFSTQFELDSFVLIAYSPSLVLFSTKIIRGIQMGWYLVWWIYAPKIPTTTSSPHFTLIWITCIILW